MGTAHRRRDEIRPFEVAGIALEGEPGAESEATQT